MLGIGFFAAFWSDFVAMVSAYPAQVIAVAIVAFALAVLACEIVAPRVTGARERDCITRVLSSLDLDGLRVVSGLRRGGTFSVREGDGVECSPLVLSGAVVVSGVPRDGELRLRGGGAAHRAVARLLLHGHASPRALPRRARAPARAASHREKVLAHERK